MKKIKNTDIAIIGMACWYPGSQNIIQFWENILAKRQQFRRILDKRLPLADYYDENRKTPDKTYGRKAAFIEGFEFDWRQKRFPKRTYESTDIVHWLALDIAHKAIRDASLDKNSIPREKTGVIVGNSLTGETSRTNDIRLRWPYFRKVILQAAKTQEYNQNEITDLLKLGEDICKSQLAPITEDTLAGSLANTIAGRIANYFDIDGGGFTIDGACASSLLAITNGATSLATNQLDLSIVGGVDVSLDPFEIVGFAKVGALATNQMRVYDRRGEGFIPGEGCGFIVMKRLEDAIRDKNKIYSVIKGWGISSDGCGGITAPKASGQAKALKRAYEVAGYKISECSFIEGHGTGTPVGDKAELEGISLVAKEAKTTTPSSIGMTSLKSIVGHTKAAAGIGAFIKATIGVNQRIAPPTAGCEQPNSVFNQENQPLYPLIDGKKFNPQKNIKAGISAMGFGGINCHVTIESFGAPLSQLKPSISETSILHSSSKYIGLFLSTQSLNKIKELISNLKNEAKHMSVSEVFDYAVAQSKTISPDMPFRAAIITKGPEDLLEKIDELQKLFQNFPDDSPIKSNNSKTVWLAYTKKTPKIGFLFPGQGSQKINMSSKNVKRFAWGQEMASEANKIFKKLHKENLTDTIFKENILSQALETQKKWKKTLTSTQFAQPAICLSSALWVKRLNSIGVFPDIVGGHSLGELSALYCAGIYDFGKLIEISTIRGLAMKATPEAPGGMLSVKGDLETVKSLLSKKQVKLEIANINSPKQTIVSGHLNEIIKFEKYLSENGHSCQKIQVSNAFHSSLVSESAKIFNKKVSFKENSMKPKIKFLSGIFENKIDEKTTTLGYLTKQITSPINFINLANNLTNACDLIIEVGPGSVLTSLIAQQEKETNTLVLPIESKPNNEYDFLKVTCSFFALGGFLKTHKMYADHLSRPYKKFREKIFIQNPLETHNENSIVKNNKQEEIFLEKIVRNMPTDNTTDLISKNIIPIAKNNPITSNEEKIYDKLVEILSNITGFEKNSITKNLRLLDDLNLDSIKAGEVISEVSNHFEINSNDSDIFAKSNSTLIEISKSLSRLDTNTNYIDAAYNQKVAVGASPITSKPKLGTEKKNLQSGHQSSTLSIFKGIISKITGFESSALHNDLRLLDDLNLDSIKAGEAISDLSEALSIDSSKINPIQLSNSTIEEISKIIDQTAHKVETIPIKLFPSNQAQQKEDFPKDNPLNSNQQTKVKNDKTESRIYSTISEYTGFDEKSLKQSMRLLDDLNLDSIKSTELITSLSKGLPTDISVDPTSLSNASINELIQHFSPKYSPNKQTLNPQTTLPPSQPFLDDVLDATSQISGYPIDSIDKNDDPINDLRLTVAQVSEIFDIISTRFKMRRNYDPERLIGKTLLQIAKIIESISKSMDKKTSKTIQDSNLNPWVRNLIRQMKPKKREKLVEGQSRRLTNDLTQSNILLIYENENQFANKCQESFLAIGARCDVQNFNDAKELNKNQLSAYSFVIMVLNRENENTVGTSENLKQLVDRYHFISNLPRPSSSPRRATTIGVIQFGDGHFGMKNVAKDYTLSSFPSFMESIHLENPEFRIRCIDFSENLSNELAIQNLIDELVSPTAFCTSGYDYTGTRMEPEFTISTPKTYNPRKIKWDHNDVIIVTGGGKGITAECTLAFAKKSGATIAIIGSSPKPNLDQSDTSELSKNIKRFKEAKINFKYYSCNIVDSAAVKQLAEEIVSDLGDITGIIHGAGKNIPRRATQVNQDLAIDEISPKILGILHLLKHINNENLKLLIGFTSILGVRGVPGNAWYGLANESLHLITRNWNLKFPKAQAICLGYSLWDEVGMAAKLNSAKKMNSTGVKVIPISKGVEHFVDLTFNQPNSSQVLITSRLWSGLENKFHTNFRFAEKVVSLTPGAEAIVNIELDLSKDIYLRDHKFSESYVFPAVFGMEAMVQVASVALGKVDFSSVIFTDLNFSSAIIVRENEPTPLTIVALIDDQESKEEDYVFDVKIFKGKVNLTKPSFYGKLRIKNKKDPISKKLSHLKPIDNLNLETDIYGPYLFHGPSYQKIINISKMDSSGTIFSALKNSTKTILSKCFADTSTTILLGDPFSRDTLLQAAQLTEDSRTLLPLSCAEWKIEISDERDRATFVNTKTIERNKNTTTHNIICQTEEGNVLETLKKLTGVVVNEKTKVLKKKGPSNSELTLPTSPLQKSIERLSYLANIPEPLYTMEPSENLDITTDLKAHPIELKNSAIEKSDAFKNINNLIEAKYSNEKNIENYKYFSYAIYGGTTTVLISKIKLGIDIIKVSNLSKLEWQNTLSQHIDFFEKISVNSSRYNFLGNAMLSAINTATILNNSKNIKFKGIVISDVGVSFTLLSGNCTINSSSSEFENSNSEKLLYTQSFIEKNILEENELSIPHKNFLKIGYKENIGFHIRWPITFKDASSSMRNLNYVKLSEWQGRAREYAFLPLLNESSKIFKDGKLGWVTNYSESSVSSYPSVGDIIEVELSSSPPYGDENSTIDLLYQWYSIDELGKKNQFGTSKMQLTWVEIISHGKVKPSPFPSSFMEFFSTISVNPAKQPIHESHLDQGKLYYEAPKAPNSEPIICKKIFETSLENSNLVGNIYFSNYASWQAKVRDYFFESCCPGLLSDPQGLGEPHTRQVTIRHLRELMPFEKVCVTMHLKKLNQNGATLLFKYYKVEHDSLKEKLAYSIQEFVWVSDSKEKITPIALPQPLHHYLKSGLNKRKL